MGAFINLDDSPMFQKQISGIEQQTDELKDRCQRLYKGCKKYMETLGEACNGDTNFADSLEAFGGGQDDPVSVSIGGPVMSKFIAAFRELASYKELLRSQVEHVLIDRLSQFLSVDVQDAKVSRQRFDKAIHAYDQARDKCSSLKKSTRDDVVADLEEAVRSSGEREATEVWVCKIDTGFQSSSLEWSIYRSSSLQLFCSKILKIQLPKTQFHS